MPLPALSAAVPVINGAVGVLSGLGSLLAGSSANDRAMMFQNQALQQWLAINIPDPEAQRVVLQQFVSQGTLAPELQHAIAQNPSEFESIVTSSSDRGAQERALSELERIGYEGGMRLQDRAALQDVLLQSQGRAESERNSIAAEMARRGQGGSGYEVAARLQGQQGTADQAANSSLKIAANAQDRALAAIEGAGSLATQYRTQDFGEQAQKATAADRIDAFNTANLRDVNSANVGLRNRAQELNLANRQDIANRNTTVNNQQEVYNKGLLQQQYDNQIKKAQGMQGVYDNKSGLATKAGENTANTISNIGGAVIGANTAGATADFWNKYFEKQNQPPAYEMPDNLRDSVNKIKGDPNSNPDEPTWKRKY